MTDPWTLLALAMGALLGAAAVLAWPLAREMAARTYDAVVSPQPPEDPPGMAARLGPYESTTVSPLWQLDHPPWESTPPDDDPESWPVTPESTPTTHPVAHAETAIDDYRTVTRWAMGADMYGPGESTLTHWAVGSELDGPIAHGPLDESTPGPLDGPPYPSPWDAWADPDTWDTPPPPAPTAEARERLARILAEREREGPL